MGGKLTAEQVREAAKSNSRQYESPVDDGVWITEYDWQAIAATLGERYTREDVESAFVSGYSLGTLPVGSDPQWDENRQTVDEHMAELGWVRTATLGKQKAKAHPYGYEPDTGAYDCTRCECGCINDISATYCNDCGGEIEIDENAEKEIYHTPRHLVFAEKHDDGSLEFGGKRYVAATLGSEINGDTSDGYHTFNELYHHRAVLFSVVVAANSGRAWKSKLHHDGTMYEGMFIVGIDTPEGQATYHYDVEPYWDMFWCRELERAPEWDGHTPEQAIERIGSLRDVVFKGPRGRR